MPRSLTSSNSNLNFGKSWKNNQLIKKLASFENKRNIRHKRDSSIPDTHNQKNLFIDYLVVIDSSVYNQFIQIYGNMPISLITNYINIFFCHVINGVSNKSKKIRK